MDGIICPICKQPISDIGRTIRVHGAINRYRRCQCGHYEPTIEVPKSEYQRLRTIVAGLGFDPDNMPENPFPSNGQQQYKTGPADFKLKSRAAMWGVENTLTFEEVETLILRDGCKCAMCDSVEFLQLEHLRPISRGGSNSIDNICLLCRDCNFSKGARMPLEWIASRPALSLAGV